MSTYRSSRILLGLVGAATVAALVVPGAAFAKGKPVEETASFNLSVPAIFVNGNGGFGLTCGVEASPPTGEPKSGYTLPGYYYVQGVNKWQAQCASVPALPDSPFPARAEWGDNLTGDAKLKAASPIRVELGLFDDSAEPQVMTGWEVVKLEPSMLDRESPYGTLAKVVSTDPAVYESIPVTNLPTRVWAPGKLVISALDAAGDPTGWVTGEANATAEINATGKVVFGYNLRVPAAGTYLIEYTFADVDITGKDAGEISADHHTISLTIIVGAGGGGGGGRK
jgi:hypothetical protein